MMMGMQIHASINHLLLSKTFLPMPHKLFFPRNSTAGKCGEGREIKNLYGFPTAKGLKRGGLCVTSSSNNVAAPMWDGWTPERSSEAPFLSDIVWPSAGAFAAMAILGKVDQMLAPKGISITFAPWERFVRFSLPPLLFLVPGNRCFGILSFWSKLASSEHCCCCCLSLHDLHSCNTSTSCEFAITFH